MSEQVQPTNEDPGVQCQSGWLSPDAAEELKSELAHSYTEWQRVRSQAWGLCDAIRNDMVPTVVCTLADMLLRELEQREPSPEIVEMAKGWQDVDAETKLGELNTARAEIETLREQLSDAQRAVSDAFAEVNSVREQLDAARSETVEVRRQRNNETDRLNATSVVSVQQRDEIAYLRTRLDEERSVSAGVREKLTAAEAAVTLQRARIERLQKCVGKVRSIMDREYDGLEFEHISGALVGLDAEPTPVAEPLDAEGGN